MEFQFVCHISVNRFLFLIRSNNPGGDKVTLLNGVDCNP